MTPWRSVLAACTVSLLLAIPAGAQSAATAPASASCDINGVARIIAVGDVHGAYDRFVEILKTVGLLDEELHWSGEKTHLVQLGDVVDRGPDSRKALDLLRRLESEAAKVGGQVHALIGNHEVMRMLNDRRYTTAGEYAAFATPDSDALRKRALESVKMADRADMLKQLPLGAVEMQLAFGQKGEYGEWLRTHDSVVKINGILFMHGGMSPAVASMSCGDINDRVRKDLTTDIDKTIDDPLSTLSARIDGPLWYRGLALEQDSFAPRLDQILADSHATSIVVAHTVQTSGRVDVRFGGRVLVMDTGMQPAYVPNGRASALEVVGDQRTIIYTDRRDPVPSGQPEPTP